MEFAGQKWGLLLLACSGLALLASCAKDDSEVVFPERDLPFRASEVYTSQGVKNADGSCTFPLENGPSFKKERPSEIVLTVQLSYDTDTCLETLERGVIDMDADPDFKLPGDSSPKQSRREKVEKVGSGTTFPHFSSS